MFDYIVRPVLCYVLSVIIITRSHFGGCIYWEVRSNDNFVIGAVRCRGGGAQVRMFPKFFDFRMLKPAPAKTPPHFFGKHRKH